MAELAKKHKERLPELKKYVEEWRKYFQKNIDRFQEFKKFVFETSVTDEERAVLNELDKPTIEFNIVEAYISRLLGEFVKNQPSVKVGAQIGLPTSMINKQFIETQKVTEAHLLNELSDSSNDMLKYNVMKDLLAGGFSAVSIYMDYVNEMSFEQCIQIERFFDPTLAVFDPLARESHKGDGRIAGELYPMLKEDFKRKYGEEALEGVSFLKNIEGFSWSYTNDECSENIVLVCELYEKRKKKVKIVKLSNGSVVELETYENALEMWEQQGRLEQPPAIVQERITERTFIDRYIFCESQVLEYSQTNFAHLPKIFVDGNSEILSTGNSSYQMTRPYCYHAKGIQSLKNFAGQSLANELENTVMHKFIAAKESIPVEYQEAYKNVQKADVLVYNHFAKENNLEAILPPPREVQRTPIPPQISETFRMSDEMTQAILGSYDNAAGMTNGALSGIAFARSAMQSNRAAMPYQVGFVKAYNRIAEIMLDLIPKYYRTPRTLPIMKPSGKREYVEINKKGGLYMNYDPLALKVEVTLDINFAMQQEIAMQTITSLMQVSKEFGQFINTKGLEVILDNIDIRGIEELKELALEFQKELAQQQQQAAQAQQQQMQLEQAKVQMEMQQAQKQLQSPTMEQVAAQKVQFDAQRDSGKLAIEEQKAETDFIETLAKVQNEEVENELKKQKIDAENMRSSVEAAISLSQHIHEKKQGEDNGGYI